MLITYLLLFDDDNDKQLFTRLYEAYERKMYAVAYSILQSQSRAEDAVHDSFLKIIKYFEKSKQMPRNEIEGWIVIIVKNIALDYIKKESYVDYTEMEFSLELVDNTESEAGYNHLVELIRKMPEEYRTVLELKFVLEWTNIDIAEYMGSNENAIGAKIFRARKKLMEAMEKEGYKVE